MIGPIAALVEGQVEHRLVEERGDLRGFEGGGEGAHVVHQTAEPRRLRLTGADQHSRAIRERLGGARATADQHRVHVEPLAGRPVAERAEGVDDVMPGGVGVVCPRTAPLLPGILRAAFVAHLCADVAVIQVKLRAAGVVH